MSDSSRKLAARTSLLFALAIATLGPIARGQDPESDQKPGAVGQFFTVREPITDRTVELLRSTIEPYLDRAAAQGQKPTLIFEVKSGNGPTGETLSGAALNLAELIASRFTGAERTVAYVPEPLKGYPVLVALACDEIVLGESASLGPITPEGQPVSETVRGFLDALARRKGRDEGLLRGMLDPSLPLREVRMADRRVRFIPEADLTAFKAENQVLNDSPAWEGGTRGVLKAERARSLQVVQLLAGDRRDLARAYKLDSIADDPTLGGDSRSVLIEIDGAVDTLKESYLKRRIGQAVGSERVNLIVFRIDSDGGLVDSANETAQIIRGLGDQGVKTIAFVERAVGLSALLPLACDEIVMSEGARIGKVGGTLSGRGDVANLDPEIRSVLAQQAEGLAKSNFYPEAIARGMIDADVEIVEALDNQSGAAVFLTRERADSEPARYNVIRVIKPAGEVLELDPSEAVGVGLARTTAGDLPTWLASRGMEGIRVDGPTWVDGLVDTLNTPWMSWLLVFVGVFMLILELKLPGIGLPAICSALAFLLFFWGHYLGGTADRLEILLFLAGLVCLVLELFVFPGFGVFGVVGILLVLSSVVMASHTFIWPSQPYQYVAMGQTLMQVTGMIIAVVVAATILGRYFPSLPLFRRMILMPESAEEMAAGSKDMSPLDPASSPFFLLGETGRTTTICRPSGKARIGDLLVDVTADGFYVEANTPIEVIEVRGSRVFVKKIGAPT